MPGLSAGQKLCILGLLTAVLGACSADDLQPTPPKSFNVVIKALGFTSQTTLPDQVLELRVVALRTAGQGIEVAEDLTPVENQPIEWQFTGLPPEGASINASESLTDDAGIGRVRLAVGPNPRSSLTVLASSGDSAPITFTVDVLGPRSELEVLSANPLLAAIDREEQIRVRLVRVFGTQRVPLANATLTATLVDGPFPSGARLLEGDGGDASFVTDDAGIGTVTFATGMATQSYSIRFCGNATCPGVDAAVLSVNVTPRGGGGTQCTNVADCSPG
ncbi:MAG: hypothetical protein AAF658_17230, partial [Myxococcota bacterium]